MLKAQVKARYITQRCADIADKHELFFQASSEAAVKPWRLLPKGAS